MSNPIHKYSKRGDLTRYNCDSDIKSLSINIDEFSKSNNIIAEELGKRISILKKITHSENIFFRIPPVYVDEKIFELYFNQVSKRVELLKSHNIKIIGETIITSDKTLFCDATHPSAKGREVFSKEIKLP